ncbi:MAG: bifunctional glutamate N-acetyltransferase/amino-acid acetyltransferase ArgJ [Armatimonadota bacterium]|nr:bifunctional glutamate N-acetyltransferase/amino-acid acetyltransferase ArgJ [Armatimonadota bacterium]
MAETAFDVIEGGLLVADGFVAAAAAAGIKPQGLDMMLLHSRAPASAAATITTNRFRAAPTYVTERHVADGSARTVIANSGNANAATGVRGMENAERMVELAARETQVPVDETLVCSTGRIGAQLPMEAIEAAIPDLCVGLSRDSARDAARAIMTTDTVPKECSVELEIGGRRVGIGAIAKGAGMICPNMATMLCFICTDAAIEAPVLQGALREAVERSFNCIAVDGDMSTNDTVIALANGQAGNEAISDPESTPFRDFAAALDYVTRDLAKKIARDGEGASKFVQVRVTGAESWQEARAVGRAVTRSNLVKTCIFGEDFNWGRIAAAVGASGVEVDPARCAIAIGGVLAFEAGGPVDYDEDAAAAVMSADEVQIDIDLRLGRETAVCWTCDMTPQYVELNAK